MVNDDQFVSIVRIVVAAVDKEILERTVSDVRPKVKCLMRN